MGVTPRRGLLGAVGDRQFVEQIAGAVDDLLAGRMICGAGGGGFLQVILKKGVSRAQLQRRLTSVFQDTNIAVWDARLV